MWLAAECRLSQVASHLIRRDMLPGCHCLVLRLVEHAEGLRSGHFQLVEPMRGGHQSLDSELAKCACGQVTSLGSEAKLDTDFADVYANSKLAK